MSDPEHPSALALESLAAGDLAPDALAHAETCAACMDYVTKLRAEAAAFAEAAPPPFLAGLEGALTPAPARGAEESEARPAREDAPKVASLGEARRRRARAFVYGALPLAIAAAAFFVLRPAPAPGPGDLGALSPPPGESTMRLKGPPVLAVVRERGEQQERFTGRVAVAPNDRLRLELTVDRAGTYEAGLLGEDGAWIVLLTPTELAPGAHFSEKAAHFDANPSPGWLLAGAPEDVARARATKSFSGLAMVPVEVTRQ